MYQAMILLGLLGALVGIVTIIKPLKVIRVSSRPKAFALLGVSFLVFVVGVVNAPTPEGQQATAPAPAAPPGYQAMSLVDLQVDMKTINGKKVATKGILQQVGEIVMLKDNPIDTTGVFVDTTKLPREDRKAILTKCTLYCSVTIAGKVASGDFQDQLVADQVAFR